MQKILREVDYSSNHNDAPKILCMCALISSETGGIAVSKWFLQLLLVNNETLQGRGAVRRPRCPSVSHMGS